MSTLLVLGKALLWAAGIAVVLVVGGVALLLYLDPGEMGYLLRGEPPEHPRQAVPRARIRRPGVVGVFRNGHELRVERRELRLPQPGGTPEGAFERATGARHAQGIPRRSAQPQELPRE